ncbi:MAG: hypothetical protein Kow009_16410 [Spirochaetales bacterium]
MYLFGTGDVRLFAMNVIIGVVVGTYSSIFIASPVLLELKKLGERWKQKKEGGSASVKKAGKQVETPPKAVEEPAVPRSQEPAAGETASVASGAPLEVVPAGSKPAFTPRKSREKRKRKGKK